MRIDERSPVDLREIKVTRDYISSAMGSVLIEFGRTRVICVASVEDKVPPFMRGEGKGWITAEYSMLPAATLVRSQRESTKGRVGGRTYEIQRLIGRSLRSVVDLSLLGERTIWVDCDVIEADGGTRTASITGAFIALCDCIARLMTSGAITTSPVTDYLAAISAGICDGEVRLDLCYVEDAGADVDMNVVMTGAGEFVEIQGTGEEATFSRGQLDALLSVAEHGIRRLHTLQREVLGEVAEIIGVKQS
jgi:ribonuclease PH